MNRMAETSRSLYNVEEVLNLLEGDPDDDEELDEAFFPGSDDELGLFEDDVDGSDSGSDDKSSDNDDGVEIELDQQEDGMRHETVLLAMMVITYFNIPCSDDRSTIAANVKYSLISSSYHTR